MQATDAVIDARRKLRTKSLALQDTLWQVECLDWDTEEEADALLQQLAKACMGAVSAARAFREASRSTLLQRVAEAEQLEVERRKQRSNSAKRAWYRRWAKSGDWSRIPAEAVKEDPSLRTLARRAQQQEQQRAQQDQDPLPDASNVVDAVEKFLKSQRRQ